MSKLTQMLAVVCTALCFSSAYAIQVSVHTPRKVDGIGFTVNGAKHGGMGSAYHASGMPKGLYSFGARVHGKDVPCADSSGKRHVKLTRSSSVLLTLKGRTCTLTVK